MGLSGEERGSARRWHVPPLPIRIGQGVGAAPPFPSPTPPLFSPLLLRKRTKERGILLGLGSPSRTPHTWRAPLGRTPPSPLYISGRGHPKGTPSLLLAVCGAPLHSYTPRSYR